MELDLNGVKASPVGEDLQDWTPRLPHTGIRAHRLMPGLHPEALYRAQMTTMTVLS